MLVESQRYLLSGANQPAVEIVRNSGQRLGVPVSRARRGAGASRRATDSKSARFGSATEDPPQPRAQLFLCQLSLTHTSVA